MPQAAVLRTSQQASHSSAWTKAFSTSGSQQKSAWKRDPSFSAARMRSQQQSLQSSSISLWAWSDLQQHRGRRHSHGQLQSGQGGGGGQMQWIPAFKQGI